MKPIIGAHVSVAGGLYKCFENAARIGASAVQIFGASPRAWRTKQPTPADIETFKTAWKASNVSHVFLHAAYLVNLATDNNILYEKSIENLSAHLSIANAIKANGLIFHIGSGENKQKVIAAIKQVLKETKGETPLVIENSAAGGKKVGATPEEIGAIIKAVGSSRVKMCLDTAHIFEAGEIESYSTANIKKLFDRIESSVGIKNLVALHVNDSKTPYGSHHDRHENIGKGYIGTEGFKNLAKQAHACGAVWLLEVPGFDNQGPDKKNIDILKKIVG
jgi:deoxyribonuclease-4